MQRKRNQIEYKPYPSLKNEVNRNFSDSFGVYKTGKYVIVFLQLVNPCEYSVNTLKGFGLRDLELTKSFCNMIKRKVAERTVETPKFPFSPDDLKSEVKKGPLCELYNAIYLSLFDTITLNGEGYAITNSKKLSCKIWSLANQWEGLLLKSPDYRNPMQVLLGMTIYRLSQSKEIIQYLNKMNTCISYYDIRSQIRTWDDMIKSGEQRTTKLKKHIVTHSSIDNIDQETDTLSIHFTSSNLFQTQDDTNDNYEELSVESSHSGSSEDIPSFELNQLVYSPTFPNFIDDTSIELITIRFETDILWSIVGGIPEKICDPLDVPLLGSWTRFNKKVSSKEFKSAVIQYMPTIPQPVSDYAVLNSYLHFLLQTVETLELKNIFAHCDEAVYSKLLHII